MNKSEEIRVNVTSRATHRGPQKSTTLNRHYVKRPTKIAISDDKVEVKENSVVKKTTRRAPVTIARSPKISHINLTNEDTPDIVKMAAPAPKKIVKKEVDLPPTRNPYQDAIDARKSERTRAEIKKISSRALKEAEIQKAMLAMKNAQSASMKQKKEYSIAEKVMKKEMAADKKADKSSSIKEMKHFKKNRGKRFLLAFAASTACMLALVAIVRVNLPNISVKVAAAQTGIEASYPSYIPRDYSLTGVYVDDNKVITIDFTGPKNAKFTLSEEKSSWDSVALKNNYVKTAFDTYDAVREQGITIYISHSNAVWVNRGMLYKLNANAGTLTKTQIKNIVTSL